MQTMVNGWVHDTYIPPTVTVPELSVQAGYATSMDGIITTANCINRIRIHK